MKPGELSGDSVVIFNAISYLSPHCISMSTTSLYTSFCECELVVMVTTSVVMVTTSVILELSECQV